MNLLRIKLPKDFMDSVAAQILHDTEKNIEKDISKEKQNELNKITKNNRNYDTNRFQKLKKKLNKKYTKIKKSRKKSAKKGILPGLYRKNYDQETIMKTLEFFGFNFDKFYFMDDYINIKERNPISSNAQKWLKSNSATNLGVINIENYIENAFGIIINTTGRAPAWVPGSSGNHWLSIKKEDGEYYLLDSAKFGKGRQKKTYNEFISYIKDQISRGSHFFIVTKKQNKLNTPFNSKVTHSLTLNNTSKFTNNEFTKVKLNTPTEPNFNNPNNLHQPSPFSSVKQSSPYTSISTGLNAPDISVPSLSAPGLNEAISLNAHYDNINLQQKTDEQNFNAASIGYTAFNEKKLPKSNTALNPTVKLTEEEEFNNLSIGLDAFNKNPFKT